VGGSSLLRTFGSCFDDDRVAMVEELPLVVDMHVDRLIMQDQIQTKAE
jgi:hypothetical protein